MFSFLTTSVTIPGWLLIFATLVWCFCVLITVYAMSTHTTHWGVKWLRAFGRECAEHLKTKSDYYALRASIFDSIEKGVKEKLDRETRKFQTEFLYNIEYRINKALEILQEEFGGSAKLDMELSDEAIPRFKAVIIYQLMLERPKECQEEMEVICQLAEAMKAYPEIFKSQFKVLALNKKFKDRELTPDSYREYMAELQGILDSISLSHGAKSSNLAKESTTPENSPEN